MGFQQVRLWVADQGLDVALDLALLADALEQRLQCRQRAADQQQGGDDADRLQPVVELEQHHGVEHQHQIECRQHSVGLGKPVVREALDQGQDDQHADGVERPFPQGFGQAALAAQRLLDRAQFRRRTAALGRLDQPAPADRPLGALGPDPVHAGEQQGADAEPLVQPVHLVEPAQQRLRAARAHGQHHRHAHGGDGDDAGVLHQYRT
ncbi:hypothetical protein D3C80_569560 [compost metagenome]